MAEDLSSDCLSDQAVEAALVQLKSLTPLYAQRVDELIFAYGHLEQFDPEREVLRHRVREVLMEWSLLVMELGGHPCDLWTAVFQGAQGETRWQYPFSRLEERRPHK